MLAHLAELGTPPDDGAAVLRVSAGLSESLDRIERETLPFIAAGGGEIQFVFGPYGRGKTHFLKVLAHWASERGCVTAYVDCQRPFESLVETYRAIAAGMTPPGTHNFFAATGITRTIEARFTGLNAIDQRAVIARLKADRALSPDFRNLALAYCTEAVAGGGDEDLADRLEALLANTPTFRVTLGTLYREYSQLPRPLGKLARRNAAVWLRSVLSLPQVLGYNGLVVLFDETEAALRSYGQRSFPQPAPAGASRTYPHVRRPHGNRCVSRMCHLLRGDGRVYRYRRQKPRGAESTNRTSPATRVGTGSPNPRAIWVDIDELTQPGPQDPRFFAELGDRIFDIGLEAGLRPSDERSVRNSLRQLGQEYANSITEGRVREFVKEAAAWVADKVASANTQGRLE